MYFGYIVNFRQAQVDPEHLSASRQVVEWVKQNKKPLKIEWFYFGIPVMKATSQINQA
jgi:hypothetical protein